MPESIRDAVSVGDIIRSAWPVASPTHLNLYLGSGRMGACFDAWGLMNEAFRCNQQISGNNPTVVMSADHWFRDVDGTDWWLPAVRLAWADATPAIPTKYHQQLHLFTGQLRTEMRGAGYQLEVINAFSPAEPDVLAVMIQHTAAAPLPSLLLSPQLEFLASTVPVKGAAQWSKSGDDHWTGRLQIGSADTAIDLQVINEQGSVTLAATRAGLSIAFARGAGRHLFLIRISSWDTRKDQSTRSIDSVLADFSKAWQKRWGDAYLSLPVLEHQQIWARSMFYVLSSYGADVRSPAPPMGWAGLGWWQHFPQDLSYIHPALLRFGHLDIARAWIEYYHSTIDEMRSYTRRVFKADGTMWAWQYPIGPNSTVPVEAAPGPFKWQIHNVGYPARMAIRTAQMLGDKQWSKDIAWPVIYESAKFFGSVLEREPSGKWGIHLTPSFGQEEFGGTDAPNYLCSLFSAGYTLRAALEIAESLGISAPEVPAWNAILKDGLALENLLDPGDGNYSGIYSTNGAVRASEIVGHEKHPIQLGPLAFLPQGTIDAPTRKAFERRADLCDSFQKKIGWGWTLPMFWLADVHMGKPAEFMQDLNLALPYRMVDPEWIQIYESTGFGVFYVTSHGLHLQAFADAFVSDFFGDVCIENAVPAEWNGATYRNLRAIDGSTHSGQVKAKSG